MIDKNKMQIEILKDLLSPRSSCRLVFVSDDEIAITDGYKLVIFQADSLYIDTSLIPEMSFDFTEARKDHKAQTVRWFPTCKSNMPSCSRDVCCTPRAARATSTPRTAWGTWLACSYLCESKKSSERTNTPGEIRGFLIFMVDIR